MKHRYSVPRILSANGVSSRSVEYCEACGLLRATSSNRTTRRSTSVYFWPGDAERNTNMFAEPPCPFPYASTKTRTKKPRASSPSSARVHVAHAVTRDVWAKASGFAGMLHIRNHERVTDRVSFIKPRQLVHVLCGAHDSTKPEELGWLELVHAVNPRMFAAGDSLCAACVLLVRRRGRGLVIPDSEVIEEER